MLNLNINNETDQLKVVLIGIASDFGGTPRIEDAFDPTSKEHIKAGTYPEEKRLAYELSSLKKILKKYNVRVLEPINIKNCNQIFTRDIGFVIGKKLIISKMISNRKKEQNGLSQVIPQINKKDIITLPKNNRIEGGDVILYNNYIFIGTCNKKDIEKEVSRTNLNSINTLKNYFPEKKIKHFELIKSNQNPKKSALHLDCCFQPIGEKNAIICKDAFANQNDVFWLEKLFKKNNLIEITLEEMKKMNANLFSISKSIIISEKKMYRLNNLLSKMGFTIEEISYHEVSKMGGLLRCSTLPLERKK